MLRGGRVLGQNARPGVTRGTAGPARTLTPDPAPAAMRRLPLLAALLVLAGCSGATFEDVLNTPDPLDWTYFEGTSSEVVLALQEIYALSNARVESVVADDALGGTVVTISSRRGSAVPAQILVQPTAAEGYQSRAQVHPAGRPLSRDLEIAISGRV